MFDQYSYLYVEDDPFSREIMNVAMTATMGVKTLTMFEDSANFMERLQALPQRPDLIMLDIHLEPHSGIDLLKMIREDGMYENATVVALTASVMNEEVQILKSSGFDGAIAKPVDVETISHLIKRILDGERVWHIA
jgi:two-component system sensor histidine kinase TorS